MLSVVLGGPILRFPPRAALALCLSTGCVHVYQPMAGLHGPVVVDPTVTNFPELRLAVVCDRGDLLSREEARVLCQHVGTLFENQGATVTTLAAGERPYEVAEEGQGSQPLLVDLEMELTSREVHSSNDPVSWALCILTASVVPAVTERTFALDVVIRDGHGFLLVADSLQGRIIRRGGVGVWATNALMDRLVRSEQDQLGGDSASQDLSADLYGQLSQMVFNAQMQARVLSQPVGVP